MPDQLLDCAASALGPVEVVQDCSWSHDMSAVLRLRDASGTDWFLKHHRERDRYLAELAAYRAWVPALREAAPRLRAFCGQHEVIIVSAVSGEPAPSPASGRAATTSGRPAELHLQRQAGAQLRRLHDAQPPRLSPGFAALKLREFERLRPAAAGLLRPPELDAARACVSALAQAPTPDLVPCHHDYTPRNWLVGHDGTVRVIDFEWSALNAWVADLARLHLGAWVGRPDLRDAFLAGYGRDLTPGDQAMLHACAVLTGVWLVVKADETRRPSFTETNLAALRGILRGPPPARG